MKRAIVLVGPKGSGKSTIGALLETRIGARFVRVEPLFLQVRAALGPSHPEFERRGFEAVLARLSRELSSADTVCLESTGASSEFPPFLDELGRLAAVALVQVVGDPNLCRERIRLRDASLHIPVSDDEVDRINAAAFQVELTWAARIDNRGPFDPDRIVETVARLLTEAHSSR